MSSGLERLSSPPVYAKARDAGRSEARHCRSRHRETTIGCFEWAMTAVAGIPPDLLRKFIVRTTVWIVFLAIVLFGAAGTIRWAGVGLSRLPCRHELRERALARPARPGSFQGAA